MPCMHGLWTDVFAVSYVSIHSCESMNSFTLHIGSWMTQAPFLKVTSWKKTCLKSGACISRKELEDFHLQSQSFWFYRWKSSCKWDNALEDCSSNLAGTEKVGMGNAYLWPTLYSLRLHRVNIPCFRKDSRSDLFFQMEKDWIFLWNNTQSPSFSGCGLLLSLPEYLCSIFSSGSWSCCQERAATKHRNCPYIRSYGNVI